MCISCHTVTRQYNPASKVSTNAVSGTVHTTLNQFKDGVFTLKVYPHWITVFSVLAKWSSEAEVVEHILTHWKELILWTEFPYRFKRLGFQNSFLSIPSTKLVFRIVSTFQCVLGKIFFPRDSFYWLLRKVVDASLNLFSVTWTGLHSFLLYFHQCLITRCLICFWRDLCGIMGLRTLRYVQW